MSACIAVTLEARGGRVPVVVVRPSDDLDAPSAHLPSEGRRRSAASAVQDWLNASEGALWGLCSNGVQLRLAARQRQPDTAGLHPGGFAPHLRGRGVRRLRRAVAADPCEPFRHARLGANRLRRSNIGARPAARRASPPASACATGVEAALLSLGGGFLGHPDNAALRERLASGALPLPDYFGQLLRLVYRLIFLLAAEDRNLLHPPSAPAGRAQALRRGLFRRRVARPRRPPRGLGPAPRPLGGAADRLRGPRGRGAAPRAAGARRAVRAGDDPGSGERPPRQPRPDGGDLPARLAEGGRPASSRSIGATWRPRNWARSMRACSN